MSVYFITCRGMNAVKIGTSVSPHDRLPEIQTGCPHEVKLEAAIPGGPHEERELQLRFAEHRLRGEWFKIVPEIQEIIDQNPPSCPPRRVSTPAGKSGDKRVGGPIRYGELPRDRQKRIDAEATAIARAAGQKWLNKREETGDIYFPFRAVESA